MATLNAHYVFHSSTTRNTYVLSLNTGPLTTIQVFGSGNCQGYSIISGTLTITAKDGTTNTYPVPGGQTPFIYNGLWANAADSPDGAGSPFCEGIDRLYVVLSQESNNTMVVANNATSISVVFDANNSDTAQLLNAVFPPEAS